MQTKINLKKNVANLLGAFGYLFCSLLWLWAILLYFSLIKAFALFISPSVENNVAKSSAVVDSGPNTLPIIVVAVITIIMAVLTIYIFIKIPSIIAKTSKKIVHKTAENITPTVLRIQNRKDTKKNHIKLTSHLILIIKIVLIITPIILSFLSRFMEKQIFDFYIVMYVSVWLAGISMIFFVIQYFLARLLLVKRQDLW